MRHTWLVRSGNPGLLVIVLGWACDPAVVSHIRPAGSDVLCFYDYRCLHSLKTDEPSCEEIKNTLREAMGIQVCDLFASYSGVALWAWSFGVWGAEMAFGGMKFKRAVAFNGTPFPVNTEYGIDPRRLAVTLRGFASHGTEDFNRRTYGVDHELFREMMPFRDDRENIRELELLTRFSQLPYLPEINWDTAVVGINDVIFPPKNMAKYWEKKAIMLSLHHYPFGPNTKFDGFL